MTQYYYTDGKERFGPFTLDELKDKQITGSTLVWKEGLPDWVQARQLDDLQSLLSSRAGYPPPIISPQSHFPPQGRPKNWLIESVLVTLLCCLPLGIVGIVFSTKVDTLWNAGDYEGAYKASQQAGKWVKIGAVLGFIILVLYTILFFFGFLAGIAPGLEV